MMTSSRSASNLSTVMGIPTEDWLTRACDDAELARLAALVDSPFYRFEPRADRPELFDQQRGFVDSSAKVSICCGGNGSGKTAAAAHKAARLVLERQPPPWRDTTFLVVSDNFSQVANICWKEKLETILPPGTVEYDRIRWQDVKQGFPLTVPLVPWKNHPDRNWTLEFRSLDQGRRAFQGRRYGGFWFSEQFEWPIFDEVLRGCRETWFSGAHFAEFTPIDPDLCLGVEERMESKLRGELPDWEFYRLNSELNDSDQLAPGAIESFLKTVSESLYETRRTGALPSFAGAVYPEFNPTVHVLDDERWEEVTGCRLPEFPQNVQHRRGIDFGETAAHPFVCLWGYKDGGGSWFVYDEYIEDSGLVLYQERRAAVRDRWPWRTAEHGTTYADPSRPLIIHEFCCDGIVTVPAKNAVHEGIESVRKLMKVEPLTGLPRLFIHERCTRLITELRRYRWIKSAAQIVEERGGRMPANPNAPKYEPLKWHDDTCFPAGQMVDTADGPRPIESLRAGQQVFSETGIATIEVGSTKLRQDGMVRLSFTDGRSILCTPEHRIRSSDGRWVRAGESLGVAIQCRACSPSASAVANSSSSISTRRQNLARDSALSVTVVRIDELPNPEPVYCLATSDGTFYVNGVLVKNCDALRYLIASEEIYSGEQASSFSRLWEPRRHGVLLAGRRR